MTINNSDSAGFKWSIIFSVLLHASAFLVFRTQMEYYKIDKFTTGLPVQLKYYEPEPKKKPKVKKEKKVVKKENEHKYIKKNKKDVEKTTEAKKEPEPEKPPQQTVAVIDLTNFKYPWYLDALKKKISKNWVMPANLEELAGKETVVYFRIMKNGEAKEIRIEKDSGVSELNLSGLRAVMNSKPFAPLPHDFYEEYVIIGYHFKIR